jgi:MraZ protein
VFLGTWDNSIDETGLIALPTSYRSALREGVIITRGFDLCLQGFSLEAWMRLAQRISALPLGVADARSLRRLLFGAAQQVQPDGQGRVALTADLRAHAGLSDTAVITGLDWYFEIWSPARWRGETQRFQLVEPGQFDLSLHLRAADPTRTRGQSAQSPERRA